MAAGDQPGADPPGDTDEGRARGVAPEPRTQPSTDPSELVFAIFQGGGAKGIAHVGALKAMNDEGLIPYGVAGTSAGAIVAALVAVGYSADELLDPVGRTTVLNGASPIDYLGAAAWARFNRIRRFGPALAVIAAAAVLALVIAFAWTVTGSGWPAAGAPPRWLVLTAGTVLLAALAALAVLAGPILWRGGLFDSAGLRDLVNDRLREKLKANGVSPLPELVTFADIDSAAVPAFHALKVVATDVEGHRLVLFDAATPGVVVADAVVASAAIPLAFPPPSVRGWTRWAGTVFADGGLVSNLPAWVFTVEKRALERQQQGAPIRTLAFTLKPPPTRQGAVIARIGPAAPPPLRVGDFVTGVNGIAIAGQATLARLVAAVPPGTNAVLDLVRDGRPCSIDLGVAPAGRPGTAAGSGRLGITAIPMSLGARVGRRSLLTYLVDVVETGIFGSQTIVEQFVPDLEVIELPATLTTLGFDCGWRGAVEAYRHGRETALTTLTRGREVRAETGRRLAVALKLLKDEIARLSLAPPRSRLRLYLVDPDGPPYRELGEFRVTGSVGMDADADDRLSLDPRNRAAPRVFRDRAPVFASVTNLSAAQQVMTKYEHALLWRELDSIIAVPVFSRPPDPDRPPPPERALCLDGDTDLRPLFGNTSFMSLMLGLSLPLSRPAIAAGIASKGASNG